MPMFFQKSYDLKVIVLLYWCNDGLYKVQVGAFEDRDNAEDLEKLLLKEGYEPYIKYE